MSLYSTGKNGSLSSGRKRTLEEGSLLDCEFGLETRRRVVVPTTDKRPHVDQTPQRKKKRRLIHPECPREGEERQPYRPGSEAPPLGELLIHTGKQLAVERNPLRDRDFGGNNLVARGATPG